jgi:hypothetical protein
VRLEGEDGQPKIERGEEEDAAQIRLLEDRLAKNKSMDEVERHGGQSYDEPDVEVEQEVTAIEMPGLGAVNVRTFTTASSNNIVPDNVVGHDSNPSIEESVEAELYDEYDGRADRAIEDTVAKVNKLLLVGEISEHKLLDHERSNKSSCKRPAEEGTTDHTHHSSSGTHTSTPVHEGGHTQGGGVHGKGRRQEGNGGMEHSRAGEHDEEEEHSESRVESSRDGRVESGFGSGTDGTQHDAQKVELPDLGQTPDGDYATETNDKSMERDIAPAANGVFRRVLPGLLAVAIGQVVGGLVVVVDLVAVLYGEIESSDRVGSGENIEGDQGIKVDGVGDGIERFCEVGGVHVGRASLWESSLRHG